jgi:mRNA interferase RelE/StbE
MPHKIYKIQFSRKAEKQLDKITDKAAKSILEAIFNLGEEPRPNGCKKLKGKDGFRIRVGVYRIIYEIIDDFLIIDIIEIGHRKDIYKK